MYLAGRELGSNARRWGHTVLSLPAGKGRPQDGGTWLGTARVKETGPSGWVPCVSRSPAGA